MKPIFGAEIGVDLEGDHLTVNPRGKDDRVWIDKPTDRLTRLPRMTIE